MLAAAIASPAGFLTGAANLATCFAAFAVAVAAGAYLVQRRDRHTQLLLGMTEHVDGVAKVFVEFPEIRPYFHAGEEAKGTTDLRRAEAIAVYLSNAMDFVFVHLGKIDDVGKAAWERYFAYVFQNSPVLRDFSKSTRTGTEGNSRSTSRDRDRLRAVGQGQSSASPSNPCSSSGPEVSSDLPGGKLYRSPAPLAIR